MKILLSAYACEPGQGSEEGVGWNTIIEAAKKHRVWVLTRQCYQVQIEHELAQSPIENVHFTYFDPLNWTEDWRNKQGAVQLHYYLWQIQAFFIARQLHEKINFGLSHHITYVKYWSPSFISLLPIPFLWGPVGGGELAPKSFWKDFSIRGKLYETLRDTAQGIGERDPFTVLTARRSALALATTEETFDRLKWLKTPRRQIFSQIGLSKSEIDHFAQCSQPTEGDPIRFVSIGRLLHWKGTYLGLRAFASAQIENSEYWVIGEGPEQERLQTLARELDIANKVKFWGKIPRDKLLLKLSQCHILVHPSLHDSGGQVCAEMMAAGRPIICLDLGGPAMQVNEKTGIKVPARTPEQAVQSLKNAMIRLAKSPALRKEMGNAGKQRVRELFDWEVKGRYLDRLYQEIASDG